MDSKKLRREFIEYFEERGHTIVPSSPLTPLGDPSMLFTTAGMVQFKPIFAGLTKSEYTTAASCQKCLRTSDIDIVGKTLRHHTFFEMLGNFSFGDYFKEGAIDYCWDFIVNVMSIPTEPLWVTVYEEDHEAEKLWIERTGISSERVIRLGKKDNFWGPAGATGACGPCSELFIDLGEELGCGRETCKPGCDCDRFAEIWNLVFPQYNCNEAGDLKPLPAAGIDTGLGLERLAMVVQGTYDPYLTDMLSPTISRLEELSNQKYSKGGEIRLSMRIIADHLRALVMALSENIMPSNEGQGYVLRRLLRRATLHGNRLGIKSPFLHRLVEGIVKVYGDVYPEVKEGRELSSKTLSNEEENFSSTLQTGLSRLNLLVEEAKAEGRDYIAGKDIFLLYDTYGFPLEMSAELAGDQGLSIDTPGFEREMETARKRSREATSGDEELELGDIYESLKHFVGWERTEEKSEVLEIITPQGSVKKLESGQSGELVLSPTPFYAEAGGQVSDTGELTAKGMRFEVEDVRHLKGGRISHRGKLLSGRISVGQKLTARVDFARRADIERNHTATHLLHWALRRVLGETVKQSGSLVTPDRLRFDYTYPQMPTKEELAEVEQLVNERILENIPLTTEFMPLEEAKKVGAIALFTEKYAQHVRVVRIADISAELCGGTHLSSTATIGSFFIISEGSVSAGIRRIEAVTGREAYRYVHRQREIMEEASEMLKAPAEELVGRITSLKEELRSRERELSSLQDKMGGELIDVLADEAEEIGGVLIIMEEQGRKLATKQIREMVDGLKERLQDKPAVILIAHSTDDKLTLIAGATKPAIEMGLSAGDIVRTAAEAAGGSGGGRPDFAQAGAKDTNKAKETLSAAKKFIKEKIAEAKAR